MTTTRLYYESPDISEWSTEICRTIEREDGYYVLLKETAFYPHGGGQPCDKGWMNGIPVLDVSMEADEIVHKVERLPQDTRVSCQMDWNRRFDHMQQHSGQHLLSAVCLEMYDAPTASFHLGTGYATIDVELPELSAAQLAGLEQEVNRHIYRNHSIRSYVVTGDEAALLPLVKQPKVTENIRIVEIEDVEYNACGGTHVSSTGQLGMIKLLKAEKQKGNTRIYYKCGIRALDEFNDSLRILGVLSAKFNTAKEGIIDRIEKGEAEQKQLQAELATLKENNEAYVIRELLAGREAADAPITHLFTDKSLKDLQNLALGLAAESAVPVLLATSAENKIVMAYAGTSGLSCGVFFKAHLSAYQGKGGGSDKMAQAGFPAWEDVLAFYEFVRSSLSAAVS
ncbi:alanyl-tRNA editing protein [Paenibacillus albidus]|uniref:alanyl-tRNA editing protein n=1 Tax=Paenibacillus albidus TaxID=2041023 RepID=UPI001BEC0F7F|nr:alanyl-tRNA editing protein [Paenibacillus albidus]MBT2293344.1 alanyl-tRNA editing protein [Paenibacillus albidus]